MDGHRSDADPDPTFHFDPYPDTTFHFYADQDSDSDSAPRFTHVGISKFFDFYAQQYQSLHCFVFLVSVIGSVADPRHFGVDPDPDPRIHASDQWIRILLFSSLTSKMPAKNLFFNKIFSAYYFLKLNLYHFSKIKSQKE